MPALIDRPNAALIVIDMQNGVVAQVVNRDSVIANIRLLVEKARSTHVPIVWVQQTGDGLDEGTDEWQIVPQLSPAATEPIVKKLYGDSFEATNLEDLLAELGVGSLYVTGAQTDQCVRSTIHGAFTRGYNTMLVGDAHTTEDFTEYGAPPPEHVIAHTNLYWQYHDGPGRRAGVVPAAEVDFTMSPTP